MEIAAIKPFSGNLTKKLLLTKRQLRKVVQNLMRYHCLLFSSHHSNITFMSPGLKIFVVLSIELSELISTRQFLQAMGQFFTMYSCDDM